MEYIIVLVLVVFSGIFSGLNIGLMSLDTSDLERKIKLGDNDAKKVLKIRKNGNYLLTVILLGNVAVNSAMAIFLSDIASGIIAGLVSTGLIVIFGEIIPQAIFSRYPLKYGSRLVWVIQIFSFLLYPICAPIAFLLNKILGKELPTIWNKNELREIIKDHEDMPESEIDSDEERIIIGALTFSDKKVEDIMTPLSVVYKLDYDNIISIETIKEIKETGFTRIPILHNNEITKLLNIKSLLGIEYNIKVRDLDLHNIVSIVDESNLDDVYNKMIKEKVHMFLVSDEFDTIRGIVTLEDIIEEILNEEIVDETDSIENMRDHARIQQNK